MNQPAVRFDNGEAYENYMGKWSQRVGAEFLDWLKPATGLRLLDVGCGNSAFTELFATRCAPASISGITPRRCSGSPVRDRRCAAPTFARAMRWHCPSPTAASTSR